MAAFQPTSRSPSDQARRHFRRIHSRHCARDRRRPPVPRDPFAALALRLLRWGWREGIPPWLNPETVEIDRDFCRDMICGGCDRRGSFAYRSLFNPQSGRYRAFAVCPGCSAITEF